MIGLAPRNSARCPDRARPRLARPGCILAALALLAGPPSRAQTELPEAHPLSLHETLDRAEVTLGQPFTLTVEIIHDPADTYALPADLAEQIAHGSLELRGEPHVARSTLPPTDADGQPSTMAGKARTTVTVPLTDVASMKPSVPALELAVQGPQGARKLTLHEQSLAVESLVAKEGAPNDEHAHHGPKPPEPIHVRSYLWLWLLLALAAIALAVYFWRKRRKQAAEKVEPPPPPETAENEALRRLRELRNRAPWIDAGGGRATIFELSEIVRVYLGKRLAFNAIDLTSDELVRALREREHPGFDLERFAERLQWEDLVKFAKLEPTPGECVAALDSAGELVEQARARLVAMRHADLAGPSSSAGASSATASGASASIVEEANRVANSNAPAAGEPDDSRYQPPPGGAR